MYIILAVTGLLACCVFYLKSAWLGKHLYAANNTIMRALAGLETVNISVNGDTFSYLTNATTNKPIMLLLHGFSADKNIWLHFAKHPSKDYQLLIPDFLGHGDIPYSKAQDYSAYAQAEYIYRFLQAVAPAAEISIVGNSMGGMVAAILALESNEIARPVPQYGNSIAINKLVLIDPAGAKTEFAQQLKAAKINPFEHATIDESFAFYSLTMHKPPYIPPAVKVYLARSNYLAKQEQYTHMFNDFFNPVEFFSGMGHCRAKTIVLIWGKEDKLLPVTDAESWQTILNCELHIIDNIGHMAMVECPAYTYSLIN